MKELMKMMNIFIKITSLIKEIWKRNKRNMKKKGLYVNVIKDKGLKYYK
jgi:hypothetical protein